MGAFRNLRLSRTSERICGLAAFRFRRERFFKALTGYPKKRLEYLCLMSYDISYVLCLMSYLMSYDLCLMSHLMSDVICSHGFGLCLAFV